MEQRTLAPRRILTFLVLTFALAAGGVAAAGIGEVRSALPDEFVPAQPRAGDKAEWSYTLIDAEGVPSEQALPVVRLERLQNAWTYNASGHPVWVERVTVGQANYWSYQLNDEVADYRWLDETKHRDANGVTVHVIGDEGPEVVDMGGYQGLPLGDTTWTKHQTYERFPKDPRPRMEHCLATPLPMDFEIDRRTEATGCSLMAHGLDPDAFPMTGNQLHQRDVRGLGAIVGWDDEHLEPIGTTQTSWGEALALDVEGHGLRLWFADSIPYPVQVLLAGSSSQALFTLTSFVRGDEALLDAPAGPPPAPLPQVVLGPLQPWGPVDDGVDLVLPPSEAWTIAVEHEGRLLHDFLDAHPDYFLEQSHGGYNGGDNSHTWTFQVRDGEEVLAVQVRRAPPDGTGSLLSYPPLAAVIPQDLPWQDTVEEWGAFIGPYRPNGTPLTVPTLASAAARLNALTGDQAVHFTMRYDCNEEMRLQGCEQGVGPVVDATSDVLVHDGSVAALGFVTGGAYNATVRTLRSDPAGRLDSVWEWRYDTVTEAGIGETQSSVERPSVVASGKAWGVPDGRTVATIGAAAGLLGLLYLLWPALKGGAVGLFSRTEDGAVLDLPARRAVHDAIAANPGIHVHELARVTGQAKGTVQHHLRKLVAHGKVLAAPSAGYTSYFIAGTDRRVVAAGPVLRADSARQVLQAIVASPGTNGGRIAQALGLNRGTVLHHVRRLQAAGLVTSQEEAGVSRLFTTDLAKRSLAAA